MKRIYGTEIKFAAFAFYGCNWQTTRKRSLANQRDPNDRQLRIWMRLIVQAMSLWLWILEMNNMIIC